MVDAMSQALTRMSKHIHREPKPKEKSIMDFFAKPKGKQKSYAGKGEKIHVV